MRFALVEFLECAEDDLAVLVSRLPVGSSAKMSDGIVHERAGDGHALDLAAGELVRLMHECGLSRDLRS